jgi:hypothetical protein
MANNKLPPEIHLIHGSKGMNQGTALPEKIKKRIPFAEWASNPEMFKKEVFVEETADYLHVVYGIGTDQDRHTLMMLADQLETYIHARSQQSKVPLVVKINDGKTLAPNPFISIANEAMKNSIKIMNELGLTPKSRLDRQSPEENSSVARFLRGPKG